MTDATRPLILVVDDVDEDRHVIQAVLEGGGYEVCTAIDAEIGLQLARQRRPSLVIMDVKLPGIDGWEATRRLKSDPLTARTPVVVVTAHTGERRRDRSARPSAVLLKPVGAEELLTTVSSLLT